MAILAAQEVPVSGLADVVFAPAAEAGDQAPTGRDLVLLVRNTDESSHTLTLTTPGTVRGIPIADVSVAVAAGDTAVVPLAEVYRNPSTLRAALAWDVHTGMGVAVLRLAR